MGFLDKLKNAADSVKSEIDKVRDSGKGDATSAASVGATTPMPPSDEKFLDATKPETWITADQVAGIVGVAVTGPQRADTDETDAVRFTGDGVRVEVHGVREAVLASFDGDLRRWVDGRAAGLAASATVADLGDYSVAGSRDERTGACFAWVGDTCFAAEVEGSADPVAGAEAILRVVYDWPAS